MPSALSVPAAREYRRALDARATNIFGQAWRLWQALMVPGAPRRVAYRRWLAVMLPRIEQAQRAELLFAPRWLAWDVANRLDRPVNLPALPDWAVTYPLPSWERPAGTPDRPGGVRVVDVGEKRVGRGGRLPIRERLAQVPSIIDHDIATGDPEARSLNRRGRQAASAAATAIQRTAQNAYDDAVKGQRLAVAWRRLTEPDACTYCQMLAWRGAVYRNSTHDFEAHRNCRCVGVSVLEGEPYSTQRWVRRRGTKYQWVPEGPVRQHTARTLSDTERDS